MCSPSPAFSRTRSSQLSGLQVSVKNGIETVWPKLYSARPTAPTAFMTDALWMTVDGIESASARKSRSAWVVALQHERQQGDNSTRARGAHPNGSPTTRNETSSVCALRRMSSDSVSTMSRSAIMMSLP